MARRDEFELANARARARSGKSPMAVAARFDAPRGRVVVEFHSGLELTFDPATTQGLARARPAELKRIKISPSGFGLHFPDLDADIYLPALLEGIVDSRSWMASRFGKIGGAMRSTAKAAAARRNGKFGGRPRKAK